MRQFVENGLALTLQPGLDRIVRLALVAGPLGVLAVCARRLAARAATRRPQRRLGLDEDLRTMLRRPLVDVTVAEDEPREHERPE
jgi:hypothetical protein